MSIKAKQKFKIFITARREREIEKKKSDTENMKMYANENSAATLANRRAVTTFKTSRYTANITDKLG